LISVRVLRITGNSTLLFAQGTHFCAAVGVPANSSSKQAIKRLTDISSKLYLLLPVGGDANNSINFHFENFETMKHIFTTSISLFLFLTAFSQAGTLDKSFNGTGKKVIAFSYGGVAGEDDCYDMAIQSDGKSVLAGKSSATSGGDYNFIVVRLSTDGSLDQSFNNKGYILINFSGDDEAAAVAIQSDGKIVVAGTANASGRRRKIALLRLLTSGVPDPSFGPNFSGKVITDVGNDAAT